MHPASTSHPANLAQQPTRQTRHLNANRPSRCTAPMAHAHKPRLRCARHILAATPCAVLSRNPMMRPALTHAGQPIRPSLSSEPYSGRPNCAKTQHTRPDGCYGQSRPECLVRSCCLSLPRRHVTQGHSCPRAQHDASLMPMALLLMTTLMWLLMNGSPNTVCLALAIACSAAFFTSRAHAWLGASTLAYAAKCATVCPLFSRCQE